MATQQVGIPAGRGEQQIAAFARGAVAAGGPGDVVRHRAHFHVGGAIVADSTAAAEHAEALDKARAMLAALASLDEI